VRLATIADADGARAAAVDGLRVLPLDARTAGGESIAELAAAGADALAALRSWIDGQRPEAWRPMDEVELRPAVPDPGAIYTIGLNYRPAGTRAGDDVDRPPRPLVYGKAASSVVADEAVVAWDRSVTDNVDAEVELGLVIGADATVFGYTIIDDISSRDPWLDGDQWLLGKSMPGFCPVGPWIVTADELDPSDLRLRCTINGEEIQDGRTSDMRFSIAEIVSFLGRHVALRPGDLIATGTPARLTTPPGPDRRLRSGDVVACWIEGIGRLMTSIG
jgi:2-keto-4-pentenoate hydratase/2-oxohepta-3-ene-1,7-dioic acid hydratase in catechol pathway